MGNLLSWVHPEFSVFAGEPLFRNYSWAELLHRVFSVDVLECPKCSGRMRILAAINPPEAIRKILDCLGIPSRAPPIAAASRADDGGLEVS